MKKIVSIVLVMVLAIATLTGCSTGELSYLNMMTELTSWDVTNSTGSFTINVNENGLREAERQLELEYSRVPFSKIKVDYGVTFEKSTNNCSYDITLSVDDTTVKANVAYFDNSLYISKEGVEGLSKLFRTYYSGDADAVEMCDFILEKMGTAKWVVFNLGEAGVPANTADAQKVVDIISKFITTAFKDYDTGLFTGALPKGLTFEISPDNFKTFVLGIVKYTVDHRDEIVKAGDEMLKDLMTIYPELRDLEGHAGQCVLHDDSADGCVVNVEDFCFDSTLLSANELQAAYDDLTKAFNSDEYVKNIADFKKSHYTEKITLPSSGELKVTIDGALNYKGTDLITVKGEQYTMVMNSFDGVDGEKYVCDYTTLDDEFRAYVNEKYPVKHVDIKWSSLDWSKTADITFERGDAKDSVRKKFSFDYEHVSLAHIDNRIYVPMRKLAEGMGFDVEWVAEEGKAYVTKDGQRVDMTGVIVNDTTFIKVRDFEKLGLVINYYEHNSKYGTTDCKATIDYPVAQ